MTARTRRHHSDAGRAAGLPFERTRSFAPWFVLGLTVLGGASTLMLWETVEEFDLAQAQRVATTSPPPASARPLP